MNTADTNISTILTF